MKTNKPSKKVKSQIKSASTLMLKKQNEFNYILYDILKRLFLCGLYRWLSDNKPSWSILSLNNLTKDLEKTEELITNLIDSESDILGQNEHIDTSISILPFKVDDERVDFYSTTLTGLFSSTIVSLDFSSERIIINDDICFWYVRAGSSDPYNSEVEDVLHRKCSRHKFRDLINNLDLDSKYFFKEKALSEWIDVIDKDFKIKIRLMMTASEI